MRSLALVMTLLAAVFIGCSAEEDPGAEPEPRGDCVPQSCDALGAECGSIDDGCGQLIDCGGCEGAVCGAGGQANQCSADGCVPRTCEGADAACGPIDDGCGGTLDCGDCGGASGVICSDEGQCITANCGGEGKNECGTCGELPLTPGDECLCEGTAMCTVFGLQCDDGEVQLLEDTDDDNDEVQSIIEFAELSIQEWEYDEYRVNVEDKTLALLEPKFTVTHPGGFDLNVCVVMTGMAGSIEAFCDDRNEDAMDYVLDGVRHGCCITMQDAGESTIELDFPFALAQDYSAMYAIQVRANRNEESVAAPTSCEPYVIDYSF